MKNVDLARQAMEAYAVPVASITPLKHVYNTTFRVVARSGEQYVLRISHPRRTSVEVVRSELLWLVALRQETGLHVPDPVLNKKTQYVTAIADADVPRPRLCALFHWTTGQFLFRTLTPGHLLRVGELMARLHHHATHWEQPTGFTRPRIANLSPLHQEQDDDFDETVAARAIKAVASVGTLQHGTVVAAVITRVWTLLRELGEGPADFGLIHADVHQWNYLFQKGQVGVIDFDDCGYGHWLYDLAVTLYCLTDHPRFTALKDAFLIGYRRSRPFSAEQEELLETFMALRRLQDLLWVIEERDRPAFRDSWKAQMIDGLQKLQEFVNH